MFNYVVPVDRICVVMSRLEMNMGKITRNCIRYDSSEEFSMLVTQEHIKHTFNLEGQID